MEWKKFPRGTSRKLSWRNDLSGGGLATCFGDFKSRTGRNIASFAKFRSLFNFVQVHQSSPFERNAFKKIASYETLVT